MSDHERDVEYAKLFGYVDDTAYQDGVDQRMRNAAAWQAGRKPTLEEWYAELHRRLKLYVDARAQERTPWWASVWRWLKALVGR